MELRTRLVLVLATTMCLLRGSFASGGGRRADWVNWGGGLDNNRFAEKERT